MKALVRYAVGYIFDFFRERVTAEDFAEERARRVLLSPGLDAASVAAVRAMFPGAELRTCDRSTNLWRARRVRFDAACIPMAGGDLRGRMIGLLSGARHKLLLPSADYVYRLGMRRGTPALLWAMVDRLLLAPLALVWLGVLAVGMYGSGLVGRAVEAERGKAAWRAERVLLIRLLPTEDFVRLVEKVRRRLPGAYVAAVIGSQEGREEIAAVCDAVTVSRPAEGRFDAVILVGGTDYGLGRTYLKAVGLARLHRGARRYQWGVGEELPGRPLGRAVRAAVGPALGRLWQRSVGRLLGPLKRAGLRSWYAADPDRGPSIVQIGLTKACNYHCLFCPFHNPEAEAHHKDSELPRMSYEMFARLLGDLRRMGVEMVDICGDGEPLMHPEAMEMIGLARELGFEVTLATNAALLSEGRARRLVDLGVRRMHVSFNAATEETYTQLHPGAPPNARRSIIARLRGMAEYAERECRRPIEVEFSAVLNRLNMGEIVRMVEAAYEARAGWFMLILMGPTDAGQELLPRPEDWFVIQNDIARAAARAKRYGIRTNLETMELGASAAGTRSVYERMPCYIGHEYSLVLGDGSVMFCCQCSRPLGNLHQDRFQQIWKSEAYREARRLARELPTAKKSLPECECFTACSHVAVNVEVYRKLHGERARRSIV